MVTLILFLLSVCAQQYKTMYFSQPLDHVNRKSGTISIKALVREGDPNSLMFVYTGNEAPIEFFFNMTGWLVNNLGPQYNATVAFIEHRYYGYSKPTQPDNYQFLDTTQALWDFANITQQLKPKQTTRVIAIGGSYGGMLSAMFRLKFPYLVDGAIASSAPLLMSTLKGDEFNKVVTEDYQSTDSECAKIIQQSFEILDGLTDRKRYYKKLEAIYKPCMAITDAEHVDYLKDYIYNAIQRIAQYNYPYSTNIYGPLPAQPVTVVCSVVESHFGKDIWVAMNGMYQILDLYYNGTFSRSCFDVYQTEKPTKSAWEYQTCTQLLMPIGQYGWPIDMFPKKPWDYNAFVASCSEKYGVEPRLSWEKVNYGMTTEYKNTLQYMTNIAFSYGTNDPWKVGCFQEDFDGDQNLVIGIAGASHHYDLRSPKPHDTFAVVYAREKEQSLINKWAGLNQYGLL